MKAFYIDEFGKVRSYNHEVIVGDLFKFLYYKLSDNGILIMAFIDLPKEMGNHIMIHEKASGIIIHSDQKPLGAGLLSIYRKEVKFENWESSTMEIETPEEYRREIMDFFLS